MTNHQLINQSSGDVELYTPPRIIEAARKVMGSIDMDPASSEVANTTVNAFAFYTQEDDGLAEDNEWHGNVWMNHPFGKPEHPCKPNCTKKTCVERGHHLDKYQPGNADWINKLVREYKAGHVSQACCITFAATAEAWFNVLLKRPQCYLVPRTNYLMPDGQVKKGITKGSVVTYFGPDWDRFAQVFGDLGVVHLPYEALKTFSVHVD